jgi:hypothetical protein
MMRLYRRTSILTCLLLLWGSADALADGYASPYGEWRGQTQYQAIIKSESDAAAHSVINATIDIEPGGKVIGASPDNGCRLLGIAAPGIAPNIVTLDVTLTNCSYAGFNRTYKGYLSVHTEKKYANLSLQALSVTPGKSGTFTIQSTMRR